MNLTSHDIDLLTEVANIGSTRVVSRLSLMLHDEIDIINPEVMYLDLEQAASLFKSNPENKPHIAQKLYGIINGVANLIFESNIAPLLIERLFSDLLKEERLELEVNETEALQEVTNSVISTCFTSLANLCKEEIKISVLTVALANTLDEFLPSLGSEGNQLHAYIVMNSETRIHRKKIGNLIVILTEDSSKILIIKLMDIFHNKTQISSQELMILADSYLGL